MITVAYYPVSSWVSYWSQMSHRRKNSRFLKHWSNDSYKFTTNSVQYLLININIKPLTFWNSSVIIFTLMLFIRNCIFVFYFILFYSLNIFYNSRLYPSPFSDCSASHSSSPHPPLTPRGCLHPHPHQTPTIWGLQTLEG